MHVRPGAIVKSIRLARGLPFVFIGAGVFSLVFLGCFVAAGLCSCDPIEIVRLAVLVAALIAVISGASGRSVVVSGRPTDSSGGLPPGPLDPPGPGQ